MNSARLGGTVVHSASLNTTIQHSYSCSPKATGLWLSNPADPNTTWGAQPGWVYQVSTMNVANCHDAAGVVGQFDATRAARDAAANYWQNTWFALAAANEGDGMAAWRRFDLNPYFQVNYDSYPNPPASLSMQNGQLPCTSGPNRPWVYTKTPQIAGRVSDPDGGTVYGKFGTGSFAQQDEPLDRAGIKTLVQRRFRMRSGVLSGLLETAFEAGALMESGGRILVGASTDPHEAPVSAVMETDVLRAVIVDVESMVRPVAAEPYTETCIYQIGAHRIGTDDAWVAQENSFSRYVELPDATWGFVSADVEKRHAENRLPLGDVLEEFVSFCAGADALVAYNGTESDFVLLDDAFQRADVKPPECTLVDACYLALALWPNARTHRLSPLATNLEVAHDDLRWHDAKDDCVLLARVLMRAADTVAGWPDDLRSLVASVCVDSPAWSLVRRLAVRSRGGGISRGHGHAEVAAILSLLLADHRPRRRGTATGVALEVGPALRGVSGRVDAHASPSCRTAEPRLAGRRRTR